MATPKIGVKCPECGAARATNWRYHHTADCSISRAEEQTRTEDQRWFDSGSRKINRASTAAEVALVEAACLDLPERPQTVVRRDSAGIHRTIGGHGPVW